MEKIELAGGKLFVINPETGRWGISRSKGTDRLEDTLTKSLPKKEYLGTRLLVLNSSNRCNLGCIYCSEREYSRCIPEISEEIARKTVDRAINEETKQTIVFHGSEPTTNFDWIKRVVKYGYQRMNESGKEVDFSVQSNLAKLPKGFIEFIREYKVGVSTSIDGTPEIHNKTRPYLGGKPSFEDIISNARKILACQGNLNIATVVTKFNADKLEQIADFFESEGITSWQTIPVEGNKHLAPDPTALGKYYTKLFDKVFGRIRLGKQRLEIRALSQYLASMFIHSGVDACRACSSQNAHPLLAIDHDGKVYPCDYFWSDKKISVGNISDKSINELFCSPKNLRMRDINSTECSSCTWKMNCGGGCLAGSYYSKDGKNPYCETHKAVYGYLARKMPELIEANLIKPVLRWTMK